MSPPFAFILGGLTVLAIVACPIITIVRAAMRSDEQRNAERRYTANVQ